VNAGDRIGDQHGPCFSIRDRTGAVSRGSVRPHVDRAPAVFARESARDHPPVRRAHNMEIVQEYSDHGRSGLNIAGRDGLNQLMADVEAKRTTFTSLLVYDVSRWGRFQDVDESAY